VSSAPKTPCSWGAAPPSQDFVFDRGYLEIERSDRFVMVTVREDWSFGHGKASYLTIPRERWR